jgi:hypothetical protein
MPQPLAAGEGVRAPRRSGSQRGPLGSHAAIPPPCHPSDVSLGPGTARILTPPWFGHTRSRSCPIEEAVAEGRRRVPPEAESEQIAPERSEWRAGTSGPVGDALDGPHGALKRS